MAWISAITASTVGDENLEQGANGDGGHGTSIGIADSGLETQGEVLVRVLDAVVVDGGESFFRNADALPDAELEHLLDSVGIRGNLEDQAYREGWNIKPLHSHGLHVLDRRIEHASAEEAYKDQRVAPSRQLLTRGMDLGDHNTHVLGLASDGMAAQQRLVPLVRYRDAEAVLEHHADLLEQLGVLAVPHGIQNGQSGFKL